MRHGSKIDPPNRFESVRYELDPEHWEWDSAHLENESRRKIEYLPDATQSIVSENHSPDIPFRYSINPYRGCAHGCAYCYARPTHEYLGFNAGLDFETKVMVKHDAPRLLSEFLNRRQWQGDELVFSGVTDCYQPAERTYRLTRACLELARECRQAIGIVTKNALVARDIDILADLAQKQLVHVFLSITTLDPELARDMEPRTSIPAARLRAVQMLAEAGIPVGVMVAPVIPGLNDVEIPAILEAAAAAGARTANYILLRLPLTVEPVFLEWLERTQMPRAARIVGRVRETRDGKLSSSTWGERMSGQGEIAQQIRQMFHRFNRKHGLDQKLPPHDHSLFRPPLPKSGQLRLF